jgi:hypothetical protein
VVYLLTNRPEAALVGVGGWKRDGIHRAAADALRALARAGVIPWDNDDFAFATRAGEASV